VSAGCPAAAALGSRWQHRFDGMLGRLGRCPLRDTLSGDTAALLRGTNHRSVIGAMHLLDCVLRKTVRAPLATNFTWPAVLNPPCSELQS